MLTRITAKARTSLDVFPTALFSVPMTLVAREFSTIFNAPQATAGLSRPVPTRIHMPTMIPPYECVPSEVSASTLIVKNENIVSWQIQIKILRLVTDRLGSGGWTGNASQGGSIATADADNQQAGSIDKT
jgi:hypothetical protein